MSVLSDRDIEEAIHAGRIVIRPFRPVDLQPSSVDIHLGRVFRVQRNPAPVSIIDVRRDVPHLTVRVAVRVDEPFVIHPGQFVLGTTVERVELPADLVARLEGRSSLGRLGLLIHSTAGYVDPGWQGNLTLELSNVSSLPIALYGGTRIGQLSFSTLSSPAQRPYGTPGLGSKYQGQIDPMPSKIHEDRRR